jgi:transcriptional regulator with XRE-family HTH domain
MPRTLDDDHINSQIGLRLRRRRLRLQLTQRALGKQVQLSSQAIQKYESGQNVPSPARLIMLAEVLRVPITYFFGNLSREKAISTTPDTPELSERDVRLVQQLHKLPDDIRQSFEGLVLSATRYLEQNVSTEP